jgi:hypothetical protein
MADKKWYESPACGENVYSDTAEANAKVPTGVPPLVYLGPAPLPPLPWPPAAPPPAPVGAALANLQNLAMANATAEARAKMAKIAGYACPESPCPVKSAVQQNLVGKAQWIGPPYLHDDVTDLHFTAGAVELVLAIRIRSWGQDAIQDYSVEFNCNPAVEG